MSKLLRSRKAGLSIPLVLLVVVILLAIGTGLLTLGYGGRILAIQAASGIEARCAADSGLAKAVFEMNEKLKTKPWDDSILPGTTGETLPNCDTVFSYTVTKESDSIYTVESTGNSNRAQRTVVAALRLKSPFEFAVFSEGRVDLKSSAVVDWYNYDDDDDNMKVGTNSTVEDTINLWGSAIINGDVIVGVGGAPDEVIDIKGSAEITGSTSALTDENILQSVTVPQWLLSLPYEGSIEGDTTITGSGKYAEIDLKTGKKLTIDGGVSLYIIGDVTLYNSAVLEIVDEDTNPDASLILYIGGNFEGKYGSNVNNATNDPQRLKIYGLDSCENIWLKNSSDFYGAIYAPSTDVEFYNSAEFFGSVVAENFEQKNSSKFNYDTSLRNASADDEAVSFVISRWSE